MAFKPLTEDKESLQALAFAVRQNKGDNITPEDVLAAMDLSVLDYNVKNYCDIDYTKLTSRFENWKNIGKPEELEEWVNSSVWTANAVVKSQYLTGGGYVFSNNIGDPIFRGAYREIAKDIAQNAKDSVVKRVYKTLAGGTGDKWNPADVIAVKKSKWSSLVKQMEGFKNGKPDLTKMKELKKLKDKNKAMGGKGLKVVEDMQTLYYYNQFVDEHYKSRDCVPISLKKVIATKKELKSLTTPSVKVTSFDHKEFTGLQDALELKIEILNTQFEASNAKCIVNFTLAGEKGHKMDIRGFQSAIGNDVQMQLQKGSAANHGKATLGIFTLITKLSKGRMAFSKQRAQLRKLFPKKPVPFGSAKEKHAFTSYQVFKDYTEKAKGNFSKATFEDDVPKWAKYIEFLSGRKHKAGEVLDEMNKTKDKAKFAKWLKNKVQAYEVGQVLDLAQPQIKELIKTNIMKSIYSQAASKGFRIFGDKKVTDYMSASSYVKVGG